MARGHDEQFVLSRGAFLRAAVGAALPVAAHGQDLQTVLDREIARSKSDYVVYVPKSVDGSTFDNGNEHFLVFEAPDRSMMTVWTQSTSEGAGDHRIMFAKSADDGRTWSAPRRLAGLSWPRRAVWAIGSTGLHRGRATSGRPLAGRLRSGLRHLRLLGREWRSGRPQRARVMTRSSGRLALRASLCFDDGAAPLEFHACSIAVFGGDFADRLAIEVDACRALGHQGPQVGGPGGVALQEDREGLLGEDAWRTLMNVGLDAKLDRLDHARTEQRREVLGQQARGVGHAGFGPRRRRDSRRGGSWRRLGRCAKRRIGRSARSSLGNLRDVRHRNEAGRSSGLCSRATYSRPMAPIPARVAGSDCRRPVLNARMEHG